ncbi:MAG TPA: nuclear transport factor 2 family protein [Chitinophagaceae bacterium]|jgi:ketosteroid isomerase-like protein
MKSKLKFIIGLLLVAGVPGLVPAQYQLRRNYKPEDTALYNTIVRLDSIFFAAYNSCQFNLDKYAAFYSDSLEFYHDQSGLNRSKAEVVEATKENICGKVTRELVKGSIEVYPIKGYGAVEIGLHIFHNNQEPPPKTPKIGRFVLVWQQTADGWKISRVISLH